MPQTAASLPTQDRVATTGLIVGHARESAAYAVKRPEGARSWLLLVTEGGEGRVSIAAEDHQVTQGSATILPAGIAHTYGTDPAAGWWSFWWAHFQLRPDWRPLLPRHAEQRGHAVHEVGEGVLADLLTGFGRLHAAARWPGHGPVPSGASDDVHAVAASDAGWRLASPQLESLLVQLSHSTAHPHLDPRIARVLDVVTGDPGAPHTVESLAATVSLSPSRLGHVFRTQTGRSLMAQVREVRLHHASRLLAETTLSIGQVSRASGFASQFHFSRAFRSEHGTDPTNFRKRGG